MWLSTSVSAFCSWMIASVFKIISLSSKKHNVHVHNSLQRWYSVHSKCLGLLRMLVRDCFNPAYGSCLTLGKTIFSEVGYWDWMINDNNHTWENTCLKTDDLSCQIVKFHQLFPGGTMAHGVVFVYCVHMIRLMRHKEANHMVGTLKTCCPHTTSCASTTRNTTTDQSQPKLNFDQVRASSMNGNGR